MTAEDKKQRHLGRGLAALFGDESEDYASLDKVRLSKLVAIDQIQPNPDQPRRHFDDDALADLVDSIRQQGVIQPIVVRRAGDAPNRFEIVAGERRWRAAQRAKLHEVPVIVKELTDLETLEIALVENIHREDLTPLEEAEGYRRLMEEFGHTQDVLAKALGKSRSHIANMTRLLGLPTEVKRLIEDGSLSAGHARALIGAPDPVALAQQVVRQGLNVRQTEKLAQSDKPPSRKTAAPKAPAEKDPNTASLERDLSNHLGMAVHIAQKRDGGTLSIKYKTLEQLDDVLQRLTQGVGSGPDDQEEIVEI